MLLIYYWYFASLSILSLSASCCAYWSYSADLFYSILIWLARLTLTISQTDVTLTSSVGRSADLRFTSDSFSELQCSGFMALALD